MFRRYVFGVVALAALICFDRGVRQLRSTGNFADTSS